MFKEKFVSNIRFQQVGNEFCIEGKVKAEMKKNTVYVVTTKVDAENKVITCICSCPAGPPPASCKHAFALLHALEDYSRQELYLAPTEKLQAWHRPKPVKLSPKKCRELYGKRKLSCTVEPVNVSALFENNDGKSAQYMSVWPMYLDNCSKYMPPLPALVLSEYPLIEEIQRVSPLMKSKLIFKIEEMWELELSTTQQHACTLWRKERLLRLTASKFYEIVHRRADFVKYCEQLYVSQNQELNFAPIKYGRTFESVVRGYVRTAYPKHIIRNVGLITSPFFPHLAASPDGLMHDGNDTFLLEIKCAYNILGKSLEELAENPDFCLSFIEDKWTLKKKHKYYLQVQGQLAISNLNECVFALFYKQPNYVHMEHILFDHELWKTTSTKLNKFYFDYYMHYVESKCSS
ncbi:uncharacterized protein LOC129219376 [Uloborus diversus]|uniref:uncharacterized protein LOC129219376 n=1 Tax=Uloborus diversus TaxID=327109 RepID=UPI00240A4C5B|nr:uncharacterized protein LOC129219376 [Uloborus diversus]